MFASVWRIDDRFNEDELIDHAEWKSSRNQNLLKLPGETSPRILHFTHRFTLELEASISNWSRPWTRMTDRSRIDEPEDFPTRRKKMMGCDDLSIIRTFHTRLMVPCQRPAFEDVWRPRRVRISSKGHRENINLDLLVRNERFLLRGL